MANANLTFVPMQSAIRPRYNSQQQQPLTTWLSTIVAATSYCPAQLSINTFVKFSIFEKLP